MSTLPHSEPTPPPAEHVVNELLDELAAELPDDHSAEIYAAPGIELPTAPQARPNAQSEQGKTNAQSKTCTDDAVPCPGLIAQYVKYADRLELPPIMHELTAITGIAALANGKVTIKNGGQKVSLDFWTLLISTSGGGRNTLASIFRDCLRACGLASLVSTESWGSGMAMQE